MLRRATDGAAPSFVTGQWEAIDRLGRVVRLTDEGWEHIVAEHAEFAGLQEHVQDAVSNADQVRRDAVYRHRDIHYKVNGPGEPWLKVVVHYRPSKPSSWVGEVITAYLTRRQSREEAIRWP